MKLKERKGKNGLNWLKI